MVYRWLNIFCVVTISFLILNGCKKDEIIVPEDSLSFLINSKDQDKVIQELIACAGGGQNEFFTDPDFPISIFYLPKGEVSNIKYWEESGSENLPNSSNPDLENAFVNFRLRKLENKPVFNGKLEKFLHPPISEDIRGIVSFERNDTLFYSQPIALKVTTKPTEFNPALLSINSNETLAPEFVWQDGSIDENAIYFQVVSDAAGDIVSGTYTEERNFQFYNLDNVVLNIHDVTPTPALTLGEPYTFTLMAVSEDNWVNLIIQEDFIAE